VRLNPAPINKPLVTALSPTSFILLYKEFVLVAGQGDEKGHILKTDAAHGLPSRFLPGKDAVYLFYDEFFTRSALVQTEVSEATVFEIPGVTCAVMVEETLLVISPKAARIIGSMPAPSELAATIATRGTAEFDGIMAKLARDARADVSFRVFCELWRGSQFEVAIDILSRNLIIGNIASIVALFPIITLFGEPDSSLGLSPLSSTDSQRLLKGLSGFLNFHHTEYAKETADVFVREMTTIDTALAQCLAVLAQCRDFDRLIRTGKVNIPHLQAFLKDSRSALPTIPCQAVLLTYQGDITEAMRLWQWLDQRKQDQRSFNPLFITEAAYTVRGLKDSGKLPEYLDWILRRDPDAPAAAMIALMSPNHSSEIVIGWLKANNLLSGDILLKYNCFLVRQPESNRRGASAAEDVLCSLLDVLTEIDSPGFRFDRLSFLELDDPKKDGKAEVERIVLHILKIYPENIEARVALGHVKESTGRSIRLAIYRAKRMYVEAIDLMQADGVGFVTAAEFCREAADPPAAFSILFAKFAVEDVLKTNSEAIEANLPWMNLVEFVKVIPPTLPVSKVDAILKAAFNLLLERKGNLDAQLGLSQALLTESRYRRSVVETGYCTIERGMKCAACQQPIGDDTQCAMAPIAKGGELYHIMCRPALK
jgi:hypothetical protein